MTDERIVLVETLRHPEQRHLVHLVLHAADGATGLGETFWAAGAVEAYIHEVLAPRVLSLDTGTPARIREECLKGIYGSPRAAGPACVETSAASAVDIAAWDLAARRRGASLAVIIDADLPEDGAVGTEGVPAAAVLTYNTCCDPDHEWVVTGDGPHWDYTASLQDPRALAEDLLADGFTLMKMFPFEPGRSVREGIELVRTAAAVPGMSVAVDLYDHFDPIEGRRVTEALDELGLAWIEDPFLPTATRDFADFAQTLATPLCSGETLAGRDAFARLAREGGIGLLHCDAGWSGGVSGALEAAAAAAEAGLPVTFHGCTGPIVWATSIHVASRTPNAAHVESVRTLVRGAYGAIAAGVPELIRGRAAAGGPGHGCTLTDTYRTACVTRTTGAPTRSRLRPRGPAAPHSSRTPFRYQPPA